MYRKKFYGDNPAHQITVGFDDTLLTLFAIVTDLDTRDRLLDIGSQRHEIESLQILRQRIGAFCQQLTPEIEQNLYHAVKAALPQVSQPLFDCVV